MGSTEHQRQIIDTFVNSVYVLSLIHISHLGAHTGNGSQKLKTALLLFSGKAVQADVIFGHAHHGVKGGFPAHPGQCARNAGRALHIVAHPAAAHHHSVQGLFDDFSG